MFKTGILRKQFFPGWIYVRKSVRFQSTNCTESCKPLQKVFDDQSHWEKLNKANYSISNKNFIQRRLLDSKLETGLFQNPYLKSPMGLRSFAQKSLVEAKALVEKIRNDHSPEGYRNYIVNLDKLSDILCRVIDLCEFIRASHPNSHFIQAAQECHEQMFEIMNILNTDVVLCNILKHVLTNPAIYSHLSQEEIRVGQILLEDFEKSGIYMSPEIRQQFIYLSQSISVVGQEFINNTEYVRSNFIKIKVTEVESAGLSELTLKNLSKDVTGEYYKIPTYGPLSYLILKTCPDEAIRMKIWTAMHSCSDKQVERLEQLIKLRTTLAKLMGKKNYAAYQLEGKMAKSPEYVYDFIQSLIDVIMPTSLQELKPLSMLKYETLKQQVPITEEEVIKVIKPWDRDFYEYLQNSSQYNLSKYAESISSYFPLGAVMQGLSDLFQSIYGIKLEPSVPRTGETWSPDVRRINVVSDTEGLIGVVYCDLFERQGKTTNPAHFTVCCSRNIYPDETDLSTIQVGVNNNGVKFQLPVISLVCNFVSTNSRNGPVCLLQLNEIETLFHEMGHAMHSMLGRTSLQNLSGTRCATDFVELPSILMEHFARDKRVLVKISSHYENGTKVPELLLRDHQLKSQSLSSIETFLQIKMALLDQELHSVENINDVDTVKIYHTLERKLQVLSDENSNWCGKFGHLFGYGSSYYSYLFDRAIAAKVWDHLFSQNPFNKDSGEKFKSGVLSWGGSRDPWELVADVLEEPRLAKGDKAAMQFIGHAKGL